MTRDFVIARLRDCEAELRGLGVERLYLFGSTARDEARADSDVDLFFDYRRGQFGLYELIAVKEAAARILDRPTEIMTRDSIHKRIRARVEAEAVPVFWWRSGRVTFGLPTLWRRPSALQSFSGRRRWRHSRLTGNVSGWCSGGSRSFRRRAAICHRS